MTSRRPNSMIPMPLTRPVLLTMLALSTFLMSGCRHSKPAPAAEAAAGSPSGGSPSSSAATVQAPGDPQATGSLADRLNAVESGEADKSHTVLPNWKPFPDGTTPIQVPLRAGLGIRGVNPSRAKDHPGDVPIAAYVEDISATELHVHRYNDPQQDKERVMGQYSHDEGATKQRQAEVDHRETDCDITVDRVDLASSHNLRDYVCQYKTEHFPGTEPFGVSTEVLTQLRAGQQVEFHFVPDSEATASLGAISQMMGQSELPPLTLHANLPMFSCTLHRVEPYDFAFPVMLNDEPVVLPALHAMCPFPDGREAHMYLLDELDNPMDLWHNMGVLPEVLQVVRIVLPPPPSAPVPAVSPMETALSEKKPVEVYGIYFDFNSDVIKPESTVVLKQISAILQRNPDWKLSVGGHTDNIGDDSFNQGLSERRAAAVKNALVTQYKIGPDRLSTGGYGASRPIADNNTIEGRARNRRVELERQ